MTVMAVEKPETNNALQRFLPRHSDAHAPAWLAEIRKTAVDCFLATGFPTNRQEEWRLTNVAPLLDREYITAGVGGVEDAAALAADATVARQLAAVPLLADDAVRLVLVNGRFIPQLSSPIPPGLTVCALGAAIEAGNPFVREHLGKLAQPSHHGFAALNAAAIDDGLLVQAAAGSQLLPPVNIIALTQAAGPHGVLAHPRVLLHIGRGAKLTVLSTWCGGHGPASLANAVLEAFVEESASLELVKIVNINDSDSHIASDYAHLAASAYLRSFVLNLGGELVRNNLTTILDGPGAEATLNGLTLSRGRQHVDNHTLLDHAREHCPSHELYKSILADRATGVFKGRILVRPGAQKTDSKQTSKAILLSDQAAMNSQPQLEIYADDVKCTHGSTTGPLDEEQLFYLRSRGLAAARAHAFLTYAFAADALNRIAHPALRNVVDALVIARLHEIAPE